MGDQRDGGIGWTDRTWNPVRGCSRVSPGCEHCYAERVAARFSGPGQPYEGLAMIRGPKSAPTARARWTGVVRLVLEHLADPLRWQRPRRIFVNSMSDLFHEKLSNEEIASVFGIMAAAPRHTFQVLTKRPERMVEWFRWADAHEHGGGYEGPIGAMADAISCSTAPLPDSVFGGEGEAIGRALDVDWPLPNVWLGVTAEDQKRADERIPLLLSAPAARRYVSIEPQLERVDLECWLREFRRGDILGEGMECLINRPRLDWVICGAESGHGARPFHVDWARSLLEQCRAAGVAFFGKQDAIDGHKRPLLIDGAEVKEFPS